MIGIKIFNSSFALQAIIDTYENCFFERSFYTLGQFSLSINWNIAKDQGWDLALVRGNVLQVNDDVKKVGIITAVEKKIDEGGKGSQILTVSGYELKYIFRRRVVVPPGGQDAYGLVAAAETVMKSLIDNQVISNTDTKRNFTQLTNATDSARGADYALSARYGNLAETIETISRSTDLGWMVYKGAGTGIVFDVIPGVDRTSGQSTNARAVFSTDFDTLRAAVVKDSEEKYANLVYAGGQGVGQLRNVVKVFDTTEPEDLTRVEYFVDARDLADEPDLIVRADNTLIEYGDTITIPDAQILAYSPLVYGTDYDVGDMVTVKCYDTSLDVRLSAIKESWSHLSYEITATFGLPAVSLTEQLRKLLLQQGQIGASTEVPGSFDMKYLALSASGVISPSASTSYGCTSGANGIRIQLPPSATDLAGLELEFIKLDATASAVTIIPYGAETIGGQPFLFVIEVKQRIRIMNTGSGWNVTGGSLIVDTGWINRSAWRNQKFGTMQCPYDTRSGTFLVGEKITEATSGNTGIIIADTGTVFHLWMVTGTGFFTDNRQITGQLSGATALVNVTTSTKNGAYDFYHGLSRVLTDFTPVFTIYPGSTGADAGSMAACHGSAIASSMGFYWWGVDTNNIRIQTGLGGFNISDGSGNATSLNTEDYSYRARLVIPV